MWYAVWVRSGQEDRVLELCKTFRHYHPDAYEECFIPTYEKYRKVKGQPTKQLIIKKVSLYLLVLFQLKNQNFFLQC